MAIVMARVGASAADTTGTNTYQLAGRTPTGNRVVFWFVTATHGTAAEEPATFTNAEISATLIGSVLQDAATRRTSIYWGISPASPTSQVTDVVFTTAHTGCIITMLEDNGTLNQTLPWRNLTTNVGATNGTSLAVSMAGYAATANGVLVMIGHNGAASEHTNTGGAASNVTDLDANQRDMQTPGAWQKVGYAADNQASPGFTWTNSLARWGIAVELIADTGAVVGTSTSNRTTRRRRR